MTKTINGIQVPQRADFVGSFLRPTDLNDSNRDEYVAQLVEKQKELGYTLITDGEFNRTFWHLDFFWGFGGVTHELGGDIAFNGETARLDRVYLTGKLTAQSHPFIEAYKKLKKYENDKHIAKLTIPAPAQLFQQLNLPKNFLGTRAIYPNINDLINDIAAVYRDFIHQFYAVGGRYLQLDDCSWGAILGASDSISSQRYKELGSNLDNVKEQLLTVNNLAIEGHPEDLVIATHICRGNYHSTRASEGDYFTVAPFLLAQENVDAFYLEFDDARSGSFEPLKYVADGKKVVLGLVTTKSPRLENKDTVIARIHEAEKYIPLDRLCLSPQCGFASCEIGNKLTELEQWNKLKLVKEIAETVWGK